MFSCKRLPVQSRFLDKDIHHVEKELTGVPESPEAVYHTVAELARALCLAGLHMGEKKVSELRSQTKGHQLRIRKKLLVMRERERERERVSE